MAEVITMPKLGFDMQEGMLVRWVKMEGDAVEKGDVIAEIETDKATVEVEASQSGVLFKHLVEVNTSVPIGDPIAILSEPGEKVDLSEFTGSKAVKTTEPADAVEEAAVVEAAPDKKPEDDEGSGRIKASPLAKKMAEDHQISLSQLKGSGPSGRIIKKDVEEFISHPVVEVEQSVSAEVVKETKSSPLPIPVWEASYAAQQDQKVPMNKLRQAIGRRMVESKQQVPHFYVTVDVKMDRLMALRKQVNENLPQDKKLSVNDFIVKATALALHAYPNMNSSLDGKEILHHGNINVGIAVAVEGGLLTVVVRDADVKPIRLISEETKGMATRVRSGKVKPEDVEGSTFSISNLGMYNVENFGAIINPPEAGILAVASAQEVPVIEDGMVKIGWRMKLTLSADHRVVDGVQGAEFMNILREQLENPIRLLL